MSNRKIIIFVSFGFIAASLLLAFYYFISKPERQPVPVAEDSNKAIVFKNVKYTGERRGVVDWELTAKVARKYIDKPLIELEDLKGLYKPKPDVSIEFTFTNGSMTTENESGKVQRMTGIVEKPKPEEAPTTQAVVGRYILTPRIFEHIRALKPGAGGEYQLTDAIASLLKEEAVLAYQFDGVRYDCGSKLGYLKATIEFGLRHPETGAEFADYLGERFGAQQKSAKTAK